MGVGEGAQLQERGRVEEGGGGDGGVVDGGDGDQVEDWGSVSGEEVEKVE